MSKKILVVLFFIVVFGLPVGWYLTLQIFGENKFDLPILTVLEEECIEVSGQAYLVIDSLSFTDNRTEWKRIKKRLQNVEQTDIAIVSTSKCNGDNEIIFVDESGQIRGNYEISREEADRLITEIDIYLYNLKKDIN